MKEFTVSSEGKPDSDFAAVTGTTGVCFAAGFCCAPACKASTPAKSATEKIRNMNVLSESSTHRVWRRWENAVRSRMLWRKSLSPGQPADACTRCGRPCVLRGEPTQYRSRGQRQF